MAGYPPANNTTLANPKRTKPAGVVSTTAKPTLTLKPFNINEVNYIAHLT